MASTMLPPPSSSALSTSAVGGEIKSDKNDEEQHAGIERSSSSSTLNTASQKHSSDLNDILNNWMDNDQAPTSASSWTATRIMPGKENRRISMAANATHSSLLSNGPKRVLIHSVSEPINDLKATEADPITQKELSKSSSLQQLHDTTTRPIELNANMATTPATPNSTVVSHEKPFVFCAQSLIKMSEDNSWSVRLKALEEINKRIERAFVNMENLSPQQIDTFLLIASKCHEDTQLKVASEAMKIIKLLLQMYSEKCEDKLNTLLLNAFQQLNDRRASIKDAANEILTLLREKFKPNLIIRPLIHVMMDVPERTKTAVMQYLGVLLPQTDATDEVVLSSLVELMSKIADMLTLSQPKPSITLTAASKRIVNLLYKINPNVCIYCCFYITFADFCTY
jgi:hypothetical protein